MTVLAPVTLPLHVFSCFCMPVLVVDAVTLLCFIVVSGECCGFPGEQSWPSQVPQVKPHVWSLWDLWLDT